MISFIVPLVIRIGMSLWVCSHIDNFVISGQLINSVVGCAILDSRINMSDQTLCYSVASRTFCGYSKGC